MLDYASILRGGQGLVPDMRQQMMQDRQLAMQERSMAQQDERFQYQKQAMAQQTAQAQAAQERQGQFQQDFEYALMSGNPADITRLLARYPEMSDNVRPVWEQMDERRRTEDLTQMGTIYARAQAQDYEGAARVLEQRVASDREAGQADPEDEAILAALRSGDSVQQRAAMGVMGVQLAALTGDKFATTYGTLNPADKATPTAIQKEYEWRVANFGQDAADKWLATEDTSLVTVEPGGAVYNKADFAPGAPTPQQPRGGDPASTGGGVAPPTSGPLGPWIEQSAGITASPRGRQRASGVSGTYHADNNARDFPTPTLAKNVAEGRRLKALFGPSFDVIYSENDKTGRHNDHVHVEPGPQLGAQVRGRGGPKKINSKQQYERLASGETYLAPDGTVRTKP